MEMCANNVMYPQFKISMHRFGKIISDGGGRLGVAVQ